MTHLYFDHPYEPDPEERGLYWGTRYTDTYKTFHYKTEDIYENIDVRRSGEVITKAEVCGKDKDGCPDLNIKSNVIGVNIIQFDKALMYIIIVLYLHTRCLRT